MIHSVSASDFTLQSLNNTNDYATAHYLLLVKAVWCGHCTNYLSIFKNMSNQHPDITFLVLESTKNEQLINQWQNLAHPVFTINSFPTLIAYDQTGNPIKVIKNRMNAISELN